tara:strand:- start:90559 stop:91131 length:573 start_codon:yes stop_codon:yes gene_type:complete
MKRIVIFASGSGTNVENIATYFKGSDQVSVTAVLTNKRDAKVLDRCDALHLNALYFNRTSFVNSDCVLNILEALDPDLIVLAGFLWKVPDAIVDRFPSKIINIHPALLPKYGGKGMYGMKVHEAVIEDREVETGITIHFVNAHYDEGTIIHQSKIAILPGDTPESIAKKVHALEYENYPKIIAQLLHGQT